MEEKTHYKRIIGGTQEQKQDAFKKLQNLFDEGNEKIDEYELEKSPEDLEIIKKTELIVNKIVSQYGGEPKTLPLDHIHVFKPGSILAMTKGKLAGGIHSPLGQKIGIEKRKSKLGFASTIAHELFHLKSYKSAQVGKSGEDVRPYRSGLSMFDRKYPNEESGEAKEYFAMLEEAIVAECAKKLLDEISKDSTFSEEAEAVGKFRDWVIAYYRSIGAPEEKAKEFKKELKYISGPQDKVERVLAFSDDEEKRQSYAAGMFDVLCKKGEVEFVERRIEREKLYELLDKLVVNSNGKFKNRDEAFDEFAKANFSGNYLPLARIVESILGKGSFRKLAEEFSNDPKKDGIF